MSLPGTSDFYQLHLTSKSKINNVVGVILFRALAERVTFLHHQELLERLRNLKVHLEEMCLSCPIPMMNIKRTVDAVSNMFGHLHPQHVMEMGKDFALVLR
jgi:hypothetical protein